MDTNSPLFIIILFGGACFALISLITIMFLIGRRMVRNSRGAKDLLVSKYRMEDLNPDGIYFDLKGEVDGAVMRVDAPKTVGLKSREGVVSTRDVIWTRVRVFMTQPSPYRIKSNWVQTDIEERPDWRPVQIDDNRVDEKYTISVDPKEPSGLPSTLIEALRESNKPINVVGETVIWAKKGANLNEKEIEEVVDLLLKVARILDPSLDRWS